MSTDSNLPIIGQQRASTSVAHSTLRETRCTACCQKIIIVPIFIYLHSLITAIIFTTFGYLALFFGNKINGDSTSLPVMLICVCVGSSVVFTLPTLAYLTYRPGKWFGLFQVSSRLDQSSHLIWQISLMVLSIFSAMVGFGILRSANYDRLQHSSWTVKDAAVCGLAGSWLMPFGLLGFVLGDKEYLGRLSLP